MEYSEELKTEISQITDEYKKTYSINLYPIGLESDIVTLDILNDENLYATYRFEFSVGWFAFGVEEQKDYIDSIVSKL